MPRFRYFVEDQIQEAEKDARVDDLLSPYVFFFKLGKDLFGAGEDSRVIFAKMKHPDDDLPSGWQEEANFSAFNLMKSIKGEPGQQMFSLKDLKKIKVADKDVVKDKLKKEADALGDNAFPNQPKTFNLFSLTKLLSRAKDSDEAPNFARADEE